MLRRTCGSVTWRVSCTCCCERRQDSCKTFTKTYMATPSPICDAPLLNGLPCKYRAKFSSDDDDNLTRCGIHRHDRDCVICLNPIRAKGRLTLPCGHRFHCRCIRRWLRRSETCPVCRRAPGRFRTRRREHDVGVVHPADAESPPVHGGSGTTIYRRCITRGVHKVWRWVSESITLLKHTCSFHTHGHASTRPQHPGR